MPQTGIQGVATWLQVLEQLRLEPEAAMLTDRRIEQAGAVHTIVPAGHCMGTPQVRCPHLWHCARTARPLTGCNSFQAQVLLRRLHRRWSSWPPQNRFAQSEVPSCLACPVDTSDGSSR